MFEKVKRRSQPHKRSKQPAVRFGVHRAGEYRGAVIVLPIRMLRFMRLVEDGARITVHVGRLSHAGQVLIRRANADEDGYLLSDAGGNRTTDREVKLSAAFFDADGWLVPVHRSSPCKVLWLSRTEVAVLLPDWAQPPATDHLEEHRRSA